MNKFSILAAVAATLVAQPVFAQATPLLVISNGSAQRAVKDAAPLTVEERIELAAERMCEKPFLRDLKGQVMYRDCLTEAREEVRAALVEGKQIAGLRIASR